MFGCPVADSEVPRVGATGEPRGSLIYTFKVPSAAKNCAVGVSGTPLFDVRHGDGPPRYTLIHYATHGGTEKLEREIAADGFQCDRLEPGSISCQRRKDGALEVHVLAHYEFTTDSSQVTVDVPTTDAGTRRTRAARRACAAEHLEQAIHARKAFGSELA